MHSQFTSTQRLVDAGIHKQEDADVVRILGWLFLLFDAIPAMFVWVGLRSGSQFWLWWTLIEAAAGMSTLAVAGQMYADAARLIGLGLKERAAEERSKQADEVSESLAA